MERGGRTHPTSSSALRRDTPLFLLRLYTMTPQYASLFYPLVLSYWYYRIKGIFVNSATWFVCRLVQFLQRDLLVSVCGVLLSHLEILR